MLKDPIARHHFTLGRTDYITKKINGHFDGQYGSLSYKSMPVTAENLLFVRNNDDDNDVLTSQMSDGQTKLLYLYDSDDMIGYALIARPSAPIQKTILNPFYMGERTIEIQDLRLFAGQEGKNRGGKFFEMTFDILFANYDYVYWNISSTDHQGLFSYYKDRIGMMHIGTDYVQDIRPITPLSQDNNQAA